MDWSLLERLMKSFSGSFITSNGEIVVSKEAYVGFNVSVCENELDVKCKVLEWLSRAAFKSEQYQSKRKNDYLHQFVLDGINKFLGTSFTIDDMEQIYTYLGNSCHHERTIRFIESGYDMNVLTKGE